MYSDTICNYRNLNAEGHFIMAAEWTINPMILNAINPMILNAINPMILNEFNSRALVYLIKYSNRT